jgi:peptide/nickel transport system substrate-binding protein
VFSVLAVALALTAVGPLGAQEQPKTGGVLKAAMIGEPPTLDLHTTTAVLVQHITWHVYETLYTYDRNYNAIPLLARATRSATEAGRTRSSSVGA